MIGKSYKGQTFVPIKTPEQVAVEFGLTTDYANRPGAIPIEAWFVGRGILDPVRKAGMLAFTTVRVAPPGDFDTFFRGL